MPKKALALPAGCFRKSKAKSNMLASGGLHIVGKGFDGADHHGVSAGDFHILEFIQDVNGARVRRIPVSEFLRCPFDASVDDLLDRIAVKEYDGTYNAPDVAIERANKQMTSPNFSLFDSNDLGFAVWCITSDTPESQLRRTGSNGSGTGWRLLAAGAIAAISYFGFTRGSNE